jgi:hypothetical protein
MHLALGLVSYGAVLGLVMGGIVTGVLRDCCLKSSRWISLIATAGLVLAVAGVALYVRVRQAAGVDPAA